MKLYHCTRTIENATKIVSEGFTEHELRHEALTGVFLSNWPLFDYGHFVIEVEFEASTHDMFYQLEVIEVDKPYREFVVRAETVNAFPRRLLSQAETDEIELREPNPWNEYPPGEPHKSWAEMDEPLPSDVEWKADST